MNETSEHQTYSYSLPSGLYGREREVAQIREAYHWTTLGSTQMICVSGPSGIGKTVLIQEATRKIALGQAYLISGKFEPLQQDTPMAPLIAAFRELAEQLLNEDRQQLEQWKQALMQALGTNAAVITEVIPHMERIMGKPAPVEPLSLEKSMERFQFVFRRFIQVFCRQKHPLVLFMDDLQWADDASWRMIRSFMTDPQSQSLLFVGAFRNSVPGPACRIEEELQAIASSGVAVQTVPLQPLGTPELTQLVSDTLRINKEFAGDIAHTLFQKSDGNPYLFRQWLLRSLEEEILRYDAKQGKWGWQGSEPPAISDSAHADLLLQYMMDSLDRLPDATRQALLEASSLGGECEIGLLASWRKEEPEHTLKVLEPAFHRQFIVYMNRATDSDLSERTEARRFRFIHDRLQEAANALLDAATSEQLHWHAGQYWFRHADASTREQHLFDAAGHFNKGSRLAQRPETRDYLIQANAKAGRKAKAATAYEAAGEYFRMAAVHIQEEHWERDFETCFDMMVDRLECEYMNGWTTSTDVVFEALLLKARTPYERTRVRKIAINRLLHTERLDEGIKLGLSCLRDLGIRFQPKPGKGRQWAELMLTKSLLQRKIKTMAAQPQVTDPSIAIALQVMTMLSGAAFVLDKPLFCMLSFKCLRLSLSHGNYSNTSAVLGCFSGILNHALGERQLAREALEEGIRLAGLHNQPSIVCRMYLTLGVMFYIMEGEHSDFKESFRKSIHYGLEAGDLLFIGHAVTMLFINLHLTGNLKLIHSLLPEYQKMLAQTQNQYMLPYLTIMERWVRALKVREPGTEASPADEELLDQFRSSGMDELLQLLHGLCLMQEGYWLDDRALSKRGAELAQAHTDNGIHYIHVSEFELFLGLELLLDWNDLNPSESKTFQSTLKALRLSAGKCPEHVRHKLLLVEAEHARVRGKEEQAGRLYDEAIQEAKANGYLHHAAMACECAGKFYLAQSRETRAKGYLIEAYALFQQWGASRKAEKLKEQFSEHYKSLAGMTPESVEPGIMDAAASTAESNGLRDTFDLSVVQQAFQSMAAETDQRTLIEHLLRTVVEQAGAQRGCIVMEKGKRLVVELAVDQNGMVQRQPMPLERYEEVCLPAVRYTANTGDMVLLEHASAAGRYARDPYVMSCQTKSMLSLPLQFQNQLTAVLYLENNRKIAVFKAERLDMLRMLATQTVFLLKLFPQGEEGTTPASPVELQQDETAPEANDAALPMDPLTNRELEILQLMSLGLSNQEIAQQLHITLGTVKQHTNRIFSKMNVNRRAKAVLEGQRLNLLSHSK